MDNQTYKKHWDLRGRKKDKAYKKLSKRKVRKDVKEIKEEIESTNS